MSLTSINVNNTLVTSVDSEPTVGSDSLVKSGGVFSSISEVIDKNHNDLYNFVFPFETVPLLLNLYSVIEPAFSREKDT